MLAPIEAMYCAESGLTGSLETFSCQGLEAGKTGQPPAPRPSAYCELASADVAAANAATAVRSNAMSRGRDTCSSVTGAPP